MSNLALDPKEFESEREVVLEELAMGDDDPWRALSESVEAAACGDHAYGRPIIGYEESVGALTREGMFEHYRRAYAPSNATVVVCGDVRAEDALRAVERAFAHAERSVPAMPKPAPLTFTHAPQRIEVNWPDSAKRLCIAWPGARCGSPDDAALDFVQTILTAGRNATLTRELVVDGGLASNVSAANDARAHGGLFWLFAECADAVEPAQLEEAVFAAIERLASSGPSGAQLERAFGILVAGDLFESESISDVADQIGGYALDADWRLALDGGEALRHVTVDDVRSVAERLLARSRATVGWCLPGAVTDDDDADDTAGDEAPSGDDDAFGEGLPLAGAVV
jgi:predicted Zn-dependent peptidase